MMPDSQIPAQLDNEVLEALIHTLVADRRVCVSACLPNILREIAQYDAEPSRGERRGRFENIKAAAVAQALGRVLDTVREARIEAENEWNIFLQSLERVGLRSIGPLAAQALAPLLSFLTNVNDNLGELTLWARGFYTRAVSALLQAQLSGLSEREIVVWLRRFDRKSGLSEVLGPFIQGEVEPLEKELLFHFQDGKKTARREEPQHFFSFLLQLFERYALNTREHGWIVSNVTGINTLGLTLLGSVVMSSTAVSIFRNVYGWYEGSKFFLARDFTVHGVNCFIDFLSKSGGFVHEGVQLLLAENILFPSVFRTFVEIARSVAERSLVTGARVLWRLDFLVEELPLAIETVRGTYHMTRCLEALIRRLTIVFNILPSYAVSLWERTIIPCVLAFIYFLETKKDSCTTLLDMIQISIELLECVNIMHSSAEEWLDQCCELSSRKEISSSPLDKLALWRDELTRDTSRNLNNFIAKIFTSTNISERDLYSWNTILGIISQCKTTSHAILYEDMKVSLRRLITEERRRQLQEYCQTAGMGFIVAILHCTDA